LTIAGLCMVYGALRTGVELQLQLCRLASLDRLAFLDSISARLLAG